MSQRRSDGGAVAVAYCAEAHVLSFTSMFLSKRRYSCRLAAPEFPCREIARLGGVFQRPI